jgi:hypothetical protein
MLVLNLRLRWVLIFTDCPFYSREKAPDTHSMGGFLCPRAGMHVLEKREIFNPCWRYNKIYVR